MDVSVKNISVRFDNRTVYSNFSLDILKKEFVCILGKSGCGKTVLLNCILNNIKLDSGEILIDGEPSTAPSRRLAVVYQDNFILPWLSLRENIKLGADKTSNIDDIAKKLKIFDYLDLLPKESSGGIKQRTSLARALASNSDFILMDEPFCALDAITRRTIVDEVKELCANKTVMFVTHDIYEALYLGTRIICLRDGQITLDTTDISSLTYDTILKYI